jgi:hypothetical protein
MKEQKVPIIGQHFVKEVHPSDNVRSVSFFSIPRALWIYMEHGSSCHGGVAMSRNRRGFVFGQDTRD